MSNRTLLIGWRERWNRSLLRFIGRRVRGAVDIEDLAQETYLRLLRARDLQGVSNDFFTGVLAVAVASPCVAPFMGTALAYAFAAPMLVALLVFLALGLGWLCHSCSLGSFQR